MGEIIQKQYKQLFSEGRIGQVTLRNRLVLPP
jgi:2,4-dienoyl-CoA reductase-like NADH-dependent reductase (Old Yellow Enzyme family)